MANEVVSTPIIASDVLISLNNNLRFGNCVHRNYENDFKVKYDTVTIRRPVQFLVSEGRSAQGKIQDIKQRSLNITLDNQAFIVWDMNSKDYTLKVGDEYKQWVTQMGADLANAVDSKIADMYKKLWLNYGTEGTTPDAYLDIANVKGILDKSNAPDDDRFLFVDPTASIELADAFHNVFEQTTGKEALIKGYIKKVAGINVIESNNIKRHALATDGSAQTSVTVTTTLDKNSTLSQITMTGLDKSLVVGDKFKIAGVYRVNPQTREALGDLMQFTVTEAVTYSGTDVVKFSPTIIMSDDATYPQYQNVDAYPVAAATVTFLTAYVANMGFHRNCIALVCRPLKVMPGQIASVKSFNGLSVRVAFESDTVEDTFICRADILYSVYLLDGNLGCVLLG